MKRPGVHFLLYGYADLKMSRGADEEVFPEQSGKLCDLCCTTRCTHFDFTDLLGGYVTTAADELIRRPELLKEMILDVEKVSFQSALLQICVTLQMNLTNFCLLAQCIHEQLYYNTMAINIS